jgi:monothiol glutaredoxin
MPITPDLQHKIEQILSSDDVVLFMKGTKSFPQCGFSASVVNILNTLIPKYTTVNILSDADLRQGVKEYSEWPTFPQLYVKGELVGGADIVRSLHERGELADKLGVEQAPATAPKIAVSDAALAVLREALGDAEPGAVIHFTVDADFEPGLDIGPPEPGAIGFEAGGVTFEIDRGAAARAEGTTIDFVEGPSGAGFKIENPQRPARVRAIGPRELKQLIDAGTVAHLFDVRTPAERADARIEPSRMFDDAALKDIEGLSKDTPLAFYCHSGGRSQNAAEHFVKKGFTAVYNLAGGIVAWSGESLEVIRR